MLSTLRARITATCVAITVGALACSAAVSYVITSNDDEATVRQELTALTQSSAGAINEWTRSRASMVEALSADSLASPMAALQQLEASGGFVVAYVGYPDKHAVFSRDLGIPADYDPTSRPWYQAAKDAGKLVMTQPYEDISTKKLVVTFTRPVMVAGQVKAVVAADVNLDGVNAIVAGIHPSPSSFAFLIDDKGQILAHPDAKLNLKPATDLSPELTQAAMERLTHDAAPLEVRVAGQTKLLHAELIAGTNAKLVVALDKDEAFSGLHSVLRITLLMLLGNSVVSGFIGSLVTASAFRRLSQVQAAMEEVGSGNGDLTRRLPVEGNDEVALIASAFNRFADKLAGILRDIRGTSESVQVAAAEISQGNHDLSARTEQAAASLEETAASMEELTGTVRNSAEAAMRAGQMALNASAVADQGGAVVAEVVSTMEGIATASTRIRDIIGVIDSIAFQTNILALNAAVEAARAGEQGRGFAVVASEVRNLAQRSAQAAKEIKDLITDSVDRVDAGTELVKRAGGTMTDIVQNIQNVTHILAEITAATSEQSTGIGQVNQAVSQLDSSTQQNAALVEEATAASDVLHEQASRLAEAVGQFQL